MHDIKRFLQAATEASFYVNPIDHGLTHDEIHQVCREAGFRPGEVDDALRANDTVHWGSGEYCYRMKQVQATFILDFNHEFDPDYRNPKAFQFVFGLFEDARKEFGVGTPIYSMSAVCARGESKGLPRNDIETAVMTYVCHSLLKDHDGEYSWERTGTFGYPSPNEQLASRGNRRVRKRPELASAYPVVKHVIQRRNDGRIRDVEPFPAFGEFLERLGHKRFKAWWELTHTELESQSRGQSPISTILLSAALAEAALSFVVPKAHGMGMMSKTDIEKPRGWRFSNLVDEARRDAGTPEFRIFSDELHQRGKRLNSLRQRIHAGYLIEQFPNGQIPDTRPEEAREAKDIAESMVRAVLDWLERNP